MFRKSACIIGVTAGFLFILGLQSATAEHRHQRHIKSTFGGTYINLPNFSPDGVTASWSISESSGTLGTSSSQGVSKPVYQEDPTGKCPGGLLVIDAQEGLGFGFYTDTFSNGDQIYRKVITRTECLDGEGGFTGIDTGVFAGGTGSFAGVSGTYEVSWSGFSQISNPPEDFGSFTGKGTGILVFPREH